MKTKKNFQVSYGLEVSILGRNEEDALEYFRHKLFNLEGKRIYISLCEQLQIEEVKSDE